MAHSIRRATTEDAVAASAVVLATYNLLGTSGWSVEAGQTYKGEVSTASLRTKIDSAAFAAVAEVGSKIVGFALMPRPSLLGLLFVLPDHMRQGIGRDLWESARSFIVEKFPDVKTIELNSTPHALQFYRSIGFAPISREFTFKGVRATRMAIWLPAREMGAENAP